jgi:hypothetical protein
MNSPYDMSESEYLIDKLFQLTRDGKIKWNYVSAVPRTGTITQQYFVGLDNDAEASIWTNGKSAGFRVAEKNAQDPAVVMMPNIPGRDLVAISIDHDHHTEQGAIYVLLMGLLELARRSVDKVEPKIDRVKLYLEKLAV